VVIGATSAIAVHCCRLWVQRGPVELILVARNAERAEQIADDLRRLSAQAEISVERMDFLSTPAITAAVSRWTAREPLDMALIAHGVLSPQQPCQDDIERARASIEVNGLSPVLFAEALGTVEAMRRGVPVAYLPRRWKYIMLVARVLPDFLFARLDF